MEGLALSRSSATGVSSEKIAGDGSEQANYRCQLLIVVTYDQEKRGKRDY